MNKIKKREKAYHGHKSCINLKSKQTNEQKGIFQLTIERQTFFKTKHSRKRKHSKFGLLPTQAHLFLQVGCALRDLKLSMPEVSLKWEILDKRSGETKRYIPVSNQKHSSKVIRFYWKVKCLFYWNIYLLEFIHSINFSFAKNGAKNRLVRQKMIH